MKVAVAMVLASVALALMACSGAEAVGAGSSGSRLKSAALAHANALEAKAKASASKGPGPCPVCPVCPGAPPAASSDPLAIAPPKGVQWFNFAGSCSGSPQSQDCVCNARRDANERYTGLVVNLRALSCVTGPGSEPCVWSIEDSQCIAANTQLNGQILAHTKRYTKEQVIAYYKELERQRIAGLPREVKEFQPVTNPYDSRGRR